MNGRKDSRRRIVTQAGASVFPGGRHRGRRNPKRCEQGPHSKVGRGPDQRDLGHRTARLTGSRRGSAQWPPRLVLRRRLNLSHGGLGDGSRSATSPANGGVRRGGLLLDRNTDSRRIRPNHGRLSLTRLFQRQGGCPRLRSLGACPDLAGADALNASARIARRRRSSPAELMAACTVWTSEGLNAS